VTLAFGQETFIRGWPQSTPTEDNLTQTAGLKRKLWPQIKPANAIIAVIGLALVAWFAHTQLGGKRKR
jgi:hypothetical protein